MERKFRLFCVFRVQIKFFAPSRLVNNKLLSPFRKTNKNKRKQSKTFSVYFIVFICFNWFYSVFFRWRKQMQVVELTLITLLANNANKVIRNL